MLPRRPKKYEMEGLYKRGKEATETELALYVLSGHEICMCRKRTRWREVRLDGRIYHFRETCPYCNDTGIVNIDYGVIGA